jgi:hypothetical protein
MVRRLVGRADHWYPEKAYPTPLACARGWGRLQGPNLESRNDLDVGLQVVREATAPFLSLRLVTGLLLPAIRAIAEAGATLKVLRALPAYVGNEFLHGINITHGTTKPFIINENSSGLTVQILLYWGKFHFFIITRPSL